MSAQEEKQPKIDDEKKLNIAEKAPHIGIVISDEQNKSVQVMKPSEFREKIKNNDGKIPSEKPINTTDKEQLKIFEKQMRIKFLWLMFGIATTIVLYVLVIVYDNISKIAIVSATFFMMIGIILSIKDYVNTYVKSSENLYGKRFMLPCGNNKVSKYLLNKLLSICGDMNEYDNKEFNSTISVRHVKSGDPVKPQDFALLSLTNTPFIVHKDLLQTNV